MTEIKKLNFQQYDLIITFDYKSHQSLNSKNITHITSDTFLTESDYDVIQNESYRMSEWFRHPEMVKYLMYEEINLGETFYVEFHYELIPRLKKFFEIKNITKKYPDALYSIPSSFSKITRKFVTNVIISNTDERDISTLYDRITYSLKLGNSSLVISINRNNFMLIKRVLDRITSLILGSRTKNSENILLTEFNTIRYQNLFKSPLSKNILPLCRRRPLIWNYRSFSIIKNSNCTLPKIDVKDKKEFYQTLTNQYIAKLDANDSFFMTFFQTSTLSLWDDIKMFFFELCRKRILESLYEIENIKKIFLMHHISSVLVLSESGNIEQIALHLAKKFGKRSYLLQHGICEFNKHQFHSHVFKGNISIKADKMLTWGEPLANSALSNDLKDKVLQMGSPAHENFFKIDSNNSTNDYVLVTVKSPSKIFVKNYSIKINEEHEAVLKKVCSIIKNLNKKLIIKIHPFDQEMEIVDIVNSVYPAAKILKNADILNLINNCEMLISIDGSTTIYESLILHKPVLCILVSEDDTSYDSLKKYDACVFSNTENLEKNIMNIISDSQNKKKLIKNGHEFVLHAFKNSQSASVEILKFLSTK